jgi:1L-myo-inositol 1-phosphate cytidylyltransferase / CDP-L-myo-inositol myo-inositolphosphotransferase
MTENGSPSQDNAKILTAVLLLPAEPDWYWQNMVEVPFLLRNVLTLQRVGIKKLVLWSEDKNASHEKLQQDPRVNLDVEWDNTLTLHDTQVMVLDGSTLLEKLEIVAAMAPPTQHQTDTSGFRFFPDALKQQAQETDLIKIIPPHEPSRLINKEDFPAAEERLLKSVGLSNDSLMDKLVTRFISRQLTRLFLKTPLTPNQITFLSLLLGLASAWFFYQGTFFSGITGALLLLVSAWVDCTDGEIARLKFMETPWGARFDIFCDNIVHFFVFFSIGMGLFFATGNPLYKLYGALAVFGSLTAFMILSGVIVKKKQAAGRGETSEANLTDQLANRDFIYFLLVMACIGRLDIFILLTAVGSNIFAVYLMYQRSRH